jgi:hypothetical protein
MAVRRSAKDPYEFPKLFDRPGGEPVGRISLFSPFYVHGEQRHGDEGWVFLSGNYMDGKTSPRGWVPDAQVVTFTSRYGYAIHEPASYVEFFPTPADAYSIVPGMGPKGEAVPAPSATVLGRAEAPGWRPTLRTDRAPFMELEFERQAGYPSTTPPTATPYDGRLVHVGAICGGPVDDAVVAKLRGEAERNAAVEMLFVVDETLSMQEYFKPIAGFVRDVGRAAGGGLGKQPSIAVSYYTDGPKGKRTTCSKLERVTPEAVEALAKSVEGHRQRRPPGNYDNPPERMLDGMKDAIDAAGFSDDGISIVVVIGDTGHEPRDDREKQELFGNVAQLVATRRMTVFFVHVGLQGNPMTDDRALFEKDAMDLKRRVGKLGNALAERIRYTTANVDTLTNELQASRREVDRLVEQARLMADRIVSRHTDTIPGPALVATMAKDGITLAEFDEAHQQLYVPSYAWLVSPRDALAKAKRTAQLGRHFCMAPEEAAATVALLDSVSRDVEAGVEIDHDRAVEAFAKSLGGVTRDTAGVLAVEAAWKKQGAGRTSGTFLDDFVGLDLHDAILFSQGPLGTTEESVSAKKAFMAMAKAFEKASRDEGRFWFDAAVVMP